MLAIEIEEKGPLRLRMSIVQRAIDSVGSHEYRHLYIARGDGSEDVIYDGEFACVYQSSTPFHAFGLLDAVHTNVDGFQKKVEASVDWIRLTKSEAGAIGILEQKIHPDGKLGNRHTFICLGHELAVHNEADPKIRSPQKVRISDFKHHTGDKRKVEAYYIHRRVRDE